MLHHLRQLLFVLLVCAAGNVRAAAPTDGPSVAPRDANHWGVYAQLAGRTWQGENGSMTWAWGPNDTLVETGITQQSATIRPGAVPGTLVQEHSRSHVYDGSIGADGSILWIRRGIIKLPYRMSLVDGRLVAESVKLGSDNQVAKVNRTWTYSPQVGSLAPAEDVIVATTKPVTRTAPANEGPAAPVVAAPAQTPTNTSFGWLDARIGRSFVGTNPWGATYTLDVYRDGASLALHHGTLGGARTGRMLIRPTATPGRFELLENWHGAATANSLAYIAGTPGAPATDPLDGYYADPREPGDLVIGYDIRGGYVVLVFHPNNTTGGLTYHQNGGKRSFGIRRAIGDLDYVGTAWFSPATQDAVDNVRAYAAAEQQRQAEERREEERDRAEQQQRLASAAYNSLVQATAAAVESEAQSRARLDATLDQVARQAASERQGSAAGSDQYARELANARAATERQEAIAAEYADRRAAAAALSAAPDTSSVRAAGVGSASTQDRADTCVGQPVTKTHVCPSSSGLIGRIVNSCTAHVDVRMCFMIDAGWSCQSNYGLAPERAWEPGDCKATGQVFRSVRYSNSDTPLESP